jgi:hypothetical protein
MLSDRLFGNLNGQVITVGSEWQLIGYLREHIFQRIMVDVSCRKCEFGKEMESSGVKFVSLSHVGVSTSR